MRLRNCERVGRVVNIIGVPSELDPLNPPSHESHEAQKLQNVRPGIVTFFCQGFLLTMPSIISSSPSSLFCMYYLLTILKVEVTSLPDRSFHTFRASKFFDRRIFCSSGTSCDGFPGSRACRVEQSMAIFAHAHQRFGR